MQAFPFLNGPHRDIDDDILARLPGAISIRQPVAGCEVERCSNSELSLRPDVAERARSLLASLGLSRDALAAAFDRLAWKMTEVRPATKSILDVGCGDGVELLFLHAAAPEAQIFAIDWKDDLKPEVKSLRSIRFQAVRILEYLETTDETFDLIFSNHVIEHMYDPDAVCALLRRRLNPGGMMLTALPLDGAVGSLWANLRNSHLLESSLGLGAIDLGHPWKTTPADVRDTLLSAGFRQVRCVQRQGALNSAVAGEEEELAALEARGTALYRVFFGSLNWMAKKLFGGRPPRGAVKFIYALERRAWFGGNNLKNTVAPEILVVGLP